MSKYLNPIFKRKIKFTNEKGNKKIFETRFMAKRKASFMMFTQNFS